MMLTSPLWWCYSTSTVQDKFLLLILYYFPTKEYSSPSTATFQDESSLQSIS
jgi:hypothetical protein